MNYTYKMLAHMTGCSIGQITKRINDWNIGHERGPHKNVIVPESEALRFCQIRANNLMRRKRNDHSRQPRRACYPPKDFHGRGGELSDEQWRQLKLVDNYLRQPLCKTL